MNDLLSHVDAAAAASPAPDRFEKFVVHDERMLRITVLGGGIAVGYGVTSRWHALDGAVGALVAAATGRGLLVSNESRHQARLPEQILATELGVGFQAEDLVIWSPGFVEMAERPLFSRWSGNLALLLGALAPSCPVIVLELPVPLGDEPLVRAARTLTLEINAGLRRAVDRRPQARLVPVPPIGIRPHGEPLFDADYYRRAAPPIAAAAQQMLASGPRDPVATGLQRMH